ncbi:MAG: hypothetical protein IPJ89_01590 [Candidatus Iainarchaeum archaeon]|uniref:Uncharacterized protein n=1 Tax=Candidatus Iainarchaeum sp. TaxID=3101447 RepID=A0A7T9DKC4_9ARCH|nr:MAG: hypothetical protein IPJ89_01590 [Candidatus Diapherotrites archaeon]
MKRILFISLLLLFFAVNAHAGTCSVPDITIALSGGGLVTYTNDDFGVLAGSQVTVQCAWSFDPAPSTSCTCTQGDANCYGVWMTNVFQNGDFNTLSQIPQTLMSDIDCSGAWCATQGRPTEDLKITRTITAYNDVSHVVACGFREGQNPANNQISRQVKLHAYAGDQCLPSDSGDFGIDGDCHFHDNEVLVAANYLIQPGTTHTLVDTNVRFTDQAAVPHMISVMGEFDFNGNGQFLPQLTQRDSGKIILGFIGILFIGLILFTASKNETGALG